MTQTQTDAVQYCILTLANHGWHALRTAGSHKPFDVVAWERDSIRLIRVRTMPATGTVERIRSQAHKAWQDKDWPVLPKVSVELWIRYIHSWQILDLQVTGSLSRS